ncbi:class I SAM-dependent methyltransferase [Granulicella pectinivorans]|jgi:tRNA (cmo5U34)-methyltransferase|nr:class I SAM-dependent methyltransferase [Granulicella pectinivorans]
MRENNTKTVFDTTASTYDVDRAKLIPGCGRFYQWAIDLIPRKAKRIVDLGAGSGLLSILIRERFPEAELHLVDFSAPMLDKARERMGSDDRVFYHQADYLKDSLPEDVCSVASALSIHHLEDEGKKLLFGKVYGMLRTNGVFVNADHIAGPSAKLEERYQATWLEQVRANGASEQQIADSLYRQKEDRRAPVGEQLGWMRRAGFRDVDLWFKDNCFAVMSGTKAAD